MSKRTLRIRPRPRVAAIEWTEPLMAAGNWMPELIALAGRVYVTDGNQFCNRPGPRLVESLKILAEILHPGEFPARVRGTGWEAYA